MNDSIDKLTDDYTEILKDKETDGQNDKHKEKRVRQRYRHVDKQTDRL